MECSGETYFPFKINPEAEGLISHGQRAIVTLDQSSGYKIRDRFFEKDLMPFMSSDYRNMGIGKCGIVYSGAEHGDRKRKLPNITVLPNLAAKDREVLGSTMGHYQGTCHMHIQELYEFGGYGAMVVDRDMAGVTLYYARRGDKVMIPSFCSMTLYNLDKSPLVTYDFSDPLRNESTKSLQREIGPIMCLSRKGPELHATINKKYYNREDGSGMKLKKIPKNSTIKIRLRSPDCGEIIDKFESQEVRENFWEHGVLVLPAEEKPCLGNREITGPLFDGPNLEHLRRYFLE